MGSNTRNKFASTAAQWGKKSVPFVVVALLAFAVGIKFTHFTGGQSGDLSYQSVEELYDRVRAKYDGELDTAKLENGMKKGLVDAIGDPHTVYFTAEESEQFKRELEGKFSGIGAELGKRNEQLVVIAPLEGFPAQKAGVRAGDVVLAVNGEEALKWSVEEAVSKIRGDKGTQVTLNVARGDKPQEFTITREDITVPSVKHEITGDNQGYIQISRFADDTAGLVQKAAKEFKDKKVKGVVLDVRANGGGYLQSAVDVSSLWLDKGKVIVEEREGDKVIESLKASGGNTLAGIPTVVLIDGGSASASEIVAGALQDHGVAKLVGAKSFGKGSVQALEEFGDGSELKVTIARWFTPNGKNIDKEGISPTEAVELTEDDLNAQRDPQKDRAFQLAK